VSVMDRLIFVGLYRLVPNTIKALTTVKPDTVICWPSAGFRLYRHLPALEIVAPLRPTSRTVGNSPADLPDEHRQPVVGSARARGNYRLVVAFDFRRQVAFAKFIGTHGEYDHIDALTVSQF
jgi:HigB_toxin, RelE-like toxic component of a toxin-antitoxin system